MRGASPCALSRSTREVRWRIEVHAAFVVREIL